MNNEIIKENVKFINSCGVNTFGLLGIALVVLKCLGYISISWLLVLAPFWIQIILDIILIASCLILYFYKVKISSKAFELTNFKEDKNNHNKDLNEVVTDYKSEQLKSKKTKKKTKKDIVNEQSNTTTEGSSNK